jgi:hypothetical protein
MNCKQGTEYIIRQMLDLLEGMPANMYQQPLVVFNGSSIGQHFRHILDFWSCLLRDLEKGTIDYSDRERRPILEQQPVEAMRQLHLILHQIDQLDEPQAIEVCADFIPDERVSRPLVQSTIGRELVFAHDHAIHHLAMIKMGIRIAYPQFSIDNNLGVASSTVKFRTGSQQTG